MVEVDRRVIIEFVGVSGAGKSTLINRIIETQSNSIKISTAKSQNYKEAKSKQRNIAKACKSISVIFTNPSLIMKIRNIFKKAPDIRGKNKLKLLANILYTIYEEKKMKENTTYLLDEGPFQIIWAFFLRTTITPSYEIMKMFCSLFTPSDKLIVVNTKAETIADRLNNRNSKEYIQKADNLIEKIEEMQSKLDSIIQFAIQLYFIKSDRILNFDSSKNVTEYGEDIEEIIELNA